jgi:DNA N-6-adenine-methyltransferase (Dam)
VNEKRPHVSNNSGNQNWFTPPGYVEAARRVLGEIDLDPASHDMANAKVVKATRYYTRENDGLIQRWDGRVFLNPPYAGGLVDRFVSKLLQHYQCGDVTAAIVLTNNATETDWFQRLASSASALCFCKRRIRYWQPYAPTLNDPLQGQVFTYLGPDVAGFADVFRRIGVCAVPSGKPSPLQAGLVLA